MKVVNIEESSFQKFNNNIVIKSNMVKQEKYLIVGIANGGLPLMNSFYDYCQSEGYVVDVATVMCQRPSTSDKKSDSTASVLFNYLLQKLPYFILNWLRIIEHIWLSKRSNKDLERVASWKSAKPNEQYSKIIVIDDAIDSGASFLSVVDFIKTEKVAREIFSAVIVLTQELPLYTPDYNLYKNLLVRFPWSLDAKK